MSEWVKTVLDYDNHEDGLPEDSFRIGASQLSMFMDRPHQYYREKILGEDKFEGNTSSVLGTIVHYVAEQYAKGKPVDKTEIEQYVYNHGSNEDVETNIVLHHYKGMAEALINQYVKSNVPTESEVSLNTEIMPGYYAGCTIDGIQGDLLLDYKTYTSKSKPRAIPMNYRYQLLENVFVARANGYDITRIRLVYVNRYIDGGISEKTGKPLKSYPPEVTVLTEMVTQDDMDFIESILKLCAESVDATKQNPELAYLIFRDYRLKK